MDVKQFINELDANTQKIIQCASTYRDDGLDVHDSINWGIPQILEHIYLVDGAVYQTVLRDSPIISESLELFGKKNLEKMLIERAGVKVETLSFLAPTGKLGDFREVRTKFIDQRNSLKRDLLSNKISLDYRVHEHYLLGEMTVVDWLNFLIFHAERHVIQMLKAL